MMELNMAKQIFEVKNLSFSYHTLNGETNVLNHISFIVNQGEFVSIVGPSGCGKSTLLSLISGMLSPEEGDVIFQDGIRPKMGYMLQRDHLLNWRTIYQNTILGLEINKLLTAENTEYVNNLIDEYGLADFKNKTDTQLKTAIDYLNNQ